MNSLLGTLQVQCIKKSFKSWTLKADFKVHPGERVILWGKSGMGKTTLLHLLAGLIPWGQDASGKILLGHQEVTHLPTQKRDIGFVFQDQALFADRSVFENAEFGLKVRGIAADERKVIVEDWLSRVGLLSLSSRKAYQLSIGEKQRVAFVRAVCWKPRLILLDEPFASLDQEMRRLLRQELISLHELWPAPLIMVTHDEQEALVLGHGRLIFHSDPQDHARSVTRELTKGAGFD